VVIVEISGEAGLAETASGAVAERLGEAFRQAVDALKALPAGGAVLLKYTTGADDTALTGALTSLCRTLAREAAPRGVRVNAIVAPPEAEIAALVDFLGTDASIMCTGAVLETSR
jgi:NAD(P)-dependent dehydrogenase (short-subunit alcohol dehydrogenase family)